MEARVPAGEADGEEMENLEAPGEGKYDPMRPWAGFVAMSIPELPAAIDDRLEEGPSRGVR